MDYNNRGVVITGAASGIGFATALALAKAGAKVLMSDVEPATLEASRVQVAAAAPDSLVKSKLCDVGVLSSVLELAEFAFSEFGSVHVVFNNAGVGVSGPITTMKHSDWDWVLRVNLWGAIHGTEAFAQRMVAQQQGGHILFNSSFAGLVYSPTLAPYCVSKAGVVALAEVLRQEMRAHQIGVSVVCPMRVATAIGSSARNRSADFGGREGSPELIDPRDKSLPGDIIDVDTAVARILAGIENNELYIMTHADARQYITRRFEKIDKSFDRQFIGAPGP